MVNSESPARQRTNVLAHLPPLMAELGVPLAPVLEGSGIAQEDLGPGAFIPFASALAMLDRAARISGRDDLGLLLGKRQTLKSLGPVGRVMVHADTLGEALSDYTRFQIDNSTGAAVYLYRTSGYMAFGYGIYDDAGMGALQIHDLVLTTGCVLVAELTGGRVRPVEIWSIRPQPTDPTPLQRFAGCPVRYGQDRTCMFLSADAAIFPLPEANRRAHDTALAAVAQRAARAPRGEAGRVRHAVRALMLTGRTGMGDVATHLGRHPRTLRRNLNNEGTTFEALRDEVRYAVARELLSLTALSFTDIATALGYSSCSSFSHAFRRLSGTTPTAWRCAQHGAETPRQGAT